MEYGNLIQNLFAFPTDSRISRIKDFSRVSSISVEVAAAAEDDDDDEAAELPTEVE